MKKIKKLSDLTFDERNANRHTMRGLAMVEESLGRCGAGRSVLADKNGVLIAGNGTVEVAAGMGVDDNDIIVVESDGTKLVVVQRTDLDLNGDDSRARMLAIADNRSAEVSLCWNAAEVATFTAETPDTHWLFRKDEIEAMNAATGDQPELPGNDDRPGDFSGDNSGAGKFELTLYFDTNTAMLEAARRLSAEGYRFRRQAGEVL